MFLFPQCSSVCSFSHHQHQKGCAVNGSHVSSYDSNWCNNKCCIVQSRLRKLKLRIVKIYMLHHLILMSREPYYTRSLIGLFYDVMFKVNCCLRSIMTGANMSFRMLLPGASIGPESFESYFRIHFKCKQN